MTDWYIKGFYAKFEVQNDSTLLVTENIIADCGNAPGKHGIFRVLPEQAISPDGVIKMPVKLKSITDCKGDALSCHPIAKMKYAETRDFLNKTITWKIGDPDIAVHGVNNYQIVYTVKNVIRNGNAEFDEFYWNLNGAFWDMEIDTFTADIIFPTGINQSNTAIDYYAGLLGAKGKGNVTSKWIGNNILRFETTNLQEREGVTASIAFPKNIVQQYRPTFWEKFNGYFFALIPILTLLICFLVWKKHGRDPKVNKTVIAEYDPPSCAPISGASEGRPVYMDPIELGFLFKQDFNKLISAGIIDLAVKGFLKIEETKKTSIFSGQDFKLTKSDAPRQTALGALEQTLLENLFKSQTEVRLSELKNKFDCHTNALHRQAQDKAAADGYVHKHGTRNLIIMILTGAGIAFGAGAAFNSLPVLAICLFLSSGITILFALIMPKVTQKGAEIIWQIKGFKLYMETAEKYRQQFNEKENIFEKYLPYAMVFGITKLWVNKMKELYGADYFNRYHPAWFIGAALTSFDADSFNSAVSSLSSAIASNMGTTSGASGGGSSGGGGGGGGGGGW